MLIPPEKTDFARREEPPHLELVNIVKRFGPLTAVDHVSMVLAPGTFHALLGENGAGKSTLVKCVMGFHPADEGDIVINRHSRDIRSPHDAQKYGIGMVYQHFTLVPAMTVAENLILPRNNLPGVLNWKAGDGGGSRPSWTRLRSKWICAPRFRSSRPDKSRRWRFSNSFI